MFRWMANGLFLFLFPFVLALGLSIYLVPHENFSGYCKFPHKVFFQDFQLVPLSVISGFLQALKLTERDTSLVNTCSLESHS